MAFRLAGRLGFSLGLLAALGGADPIAVEATLPGRNGDIALSLLEEGDSDDIGYFTSDGEIAMMDPAGQRRRTVASGYSAAFSPTGRLLAVSQYPSGHLVLRRTDGRKVRQLTSGVDDQPTWSPSGRRLAFSRQRCVGSGQNDNAVCTGRLFTIRTDGRESRLIADNAFDPSWSPRGRLAYEADLPRNNAYWTEERGSDIQVMNRERTETRTVAVGAQDPDWSPRGETLAYVRWRGRHSALFVARADGSGPRRIYVTRGASVREPVWSPDGRQIAFIRGKHQDHLFRFNEAVYAISSSGRGRAQRLAGVADLAITGLAWQPLPPPRR